MSKIETETIKKLLLKKYGKKKQLKQNAKEMFQKNK